MAFRIERAIAYKGAWYWARVLVIVCVGLQASRWLADHTPQWMQGFELAVYRILSESGPRDADIGHLAIVKITDEEFWKGELAGRRPTKRGYIARLLSRLCNNGAHAVALDFDMRSPLPDGSLLNHPDYKAETDELAEAIQDSPHGCRVVLARTLFCPNPPAGECTPEPTALDSYSFDPIQVTWGYINLPADPRQIPLRRANVSNGTLDSFAQAIAIADSPERESKLRSSRDFRYGSFIPTKSFDDRHVVFTADSILHAANPALALAIGGKTVLIGGSWHMSEYGRGVLADSHNSPAGVMPGVFLHANYAAALLDERGHPKAPPFVSTSVDVLVVLVAAVAFALPMSWSRRWVYLGTLVVILAIITYVFWQNLGLFLEVTVPVVLLLGHALLDEYVRMREELTALRTEVIALRGRAGSQAPSNS